MILNSALRTYFSAWYIMNLRFRGRLVNNISSKSLVHGMILDTFLRSLAYICHPLSSVSKFFTVSTTLTSRGVYAQSSPPSNFVLEDVSQPVGWTPSGKMRVGSPSNTLSLSSGKCWRMMLMTSCGVINPETRRTRCPEASGLVRHMI
jgi:hypothetical protein